MASATRFCVLDLTYDIKTGKASGDDVDIAKLVRSGGKAFLTNNKYEKDEVEEEKIGKWMMFLPNDVDEVEKIWNDIKEAVAGGILWKVKFSVMDTTKPIRNGPDEVAVMVYTKDFEDIKDVIEVLDFLESSGIKNRNKNIKYKTNKQTRAGFYSNSLKRSSIYSSNTIRAHPSIRSNVCPSDTFEYDLIKKTITSDCTIQPSDNSTPEFKWIFAKNNKYLPLEVSPAAMGKWMIFLNAASVDLAWIKVKRAVMNGDLWSVEVSTANNMKWQNTHAVMIYTRNYSDVNDVINVLDYLETSGIKPPNTVIKYKTQQQTRAGEKWCYSSDTIRSKCIF